MIRRLLLVLVALLGLTSVVHAQGGFIAPPGQAIRNTGDHLVALSFATITVCPANTPGVPCTSPTVPVYADNALTQAKTNPFFADQNGNYAFAAAPGTYTVTVTQGAQGYSYQVGGTNGGGGTPGGSNTQVQFDSSGSFGGDSNFTWLSATHQLFLGTTAQVSSASFNFTGPGAGAFLPPGTSTAVVNIQADSGGSTLPLVITRQGVIGSQGRPSAAFINVYPTDGHTAFCGGGLVGDSNGQFGCLVFGQNAAGSAQAGAGILNVVGDPLTVFSTNTLNLSGITTAQVTIGTQAAAGTFTPFTVLGAASQTADLFDVTANGGTKELAIDASGNEIVSTLSASLPVCTTAGKALTSTCTGLIGASQLAAQYTKRSCVFGLGDGVTAITAATYPGSGQMLQCPNNSGVTWTVTGIHCLTDNAGSSTVNVYNNAGTSLLTGAVTCNATKTNGGAAGTQSVTTTIVTTDGLDFVFVADGTSKYVTATVDFTY